MLNSGRHLLQLINDVLDLSKVEAGKMELYPETFPVGTVIDEVCAMLATMAQKKRIAITQRRRSRRSPRSRSTRRSSSRSSTTCSPTR